MLPFKRKLTKPGVGASVSVGPGYTHRTKKILANKAYRKVFMDWGYENLLAVEMEVSSRPPTSYGFVPIKWRWVTKRTFGTFNFFRRLDKDHEKTTQSADCAGGVPGGPRLLPGE
jgi:hypothetical protein